MLEAFAILHLTWWEYLLVAGLGVIASIINILAGGGSNLILPVLMIMGVPAAIANGTNRVGILLQAVVGVRGFHKAGKLPCGDMGGILLPTLSGGLLGALLASYAPENILKPALLLTMLAMAALMMLAPTLVMPQAGTVPRRVRESRAAFAWLFLSGVYGGFVQAGVGFVLLVALAGSLRYDLVAANALKLVCTFFFTAVALVIFLIHGHIWWDVAIALALGNVLGARLGVRIAIDVSPLTLKRILFIMTLAAVIAALVW